MWVEMGFSCLVTCGLCLSRIRDRKIRPLSSENMSLEQAEVGCEQFSGMRRSPVSRFRLKERKKPDIWEFRWYEPNGRLRSKLLGTVEPKTKPLSSRRSGIRDGAPRCKAYLCVALYRYPKTKQVSAGFRL